MNNDNYLVINDQGLAEVSPTASRDLQQAFIDTYRETQAGNTAQIGEAAHALGSDLPAQYGGLHGPSDYIKSRYQTPQTESRIAGLKTAAQLSALNQLMSNEQAKWADKYNQAYRNYQKRANSKGSGSGTTSTTGGGGSSTGEKETIVLNETDVDEDPFFKKKEQENLYNQLKEKQELESVKNSFINGIEGINIASRLYSPPNIYRNLIDTIWMALRTKK